MAKAKAKAKAKANYKRGAGSAADAVQQLQAAAVKCDFKWMKAHAASARFLGAREAEVRKALSKCSSKRSGMMGVRDPEKLLQVLESRAPWMTKEDRRLARSLRADDESMREAGVRPQDRAAHITKRAEQMMQRAYEDVDVLRWEDPYDAAFAAQTYTRLREHGVRLSPEHDADMKRWKRELAEAGVRPEDLKGVGTRGVRGTSAQHAAAASRFLRAAGEELEWLEGGRHDEPTKRKLARKVQRHLDQGASECWWARGAAKARCEAEVRRLDAALAANGMGRMRGGCVYVVEAGKKRKVTSDLASAKSAGKRMAKRGTAKITKACSRGRGSDSGTIVARCTSRGCS